MLVQLHAQDPEEPRRTEFLMQGVIDNDEDARKWFELCAVKWEELKGHRTPGFIPMVCTESYDGFMLAAKPVETSAAI